MALEYAKRQGYDTIRNAGEKEGYKYYHYYNLATLGHKLGLPHILKIDGLGRIVSVDNFTEIIWASHQEVLLNNL